MYICTLMYIYIYISNIYVYKYYIGIYKVPGLLAMCRGNLSAVTARLMSKCL